jgi:hypothetical protein
VERIAADSGFHAPNRLLAAPNDDGNGFADRDFEPGRAVHIDGVEGFDLESLGNRRAIVAMASAAAQQQRGADDRSHHRVNAHDNLDSRVAEFDIGQGAHIELGAGIREGIAGQWRRPTGEGQTWRRITHQRPAKRDCFMAVHIGSMRT